MILLLFFLLLLKSYYFGYILSEGKCGEIIDSNVTTADPAGEGQKKKNQ